MPTDVATEAAEASWTPLQPAGETITGMAVDVFAKDAERARAREAWRTATVSTPQEASP